MSHNVTHAHRLPFFRRIWKPAALTGAGGAAFTIWFEEIMMFGEDLLAVIFLPIMAGVIYLLDILIFKSRMPQRKDLEDTTQKGVTK